jgi:hypothetical protein
VWRPEGWLGATLQAEAYFTAADVCAWTVTRSREEVWTLAAAVTHENAFKLAQRPLEFAAATKFGEWRWPLEILSVHDHALTAQLGPPVRRLRRQEPYGKQPVRGAEDRPTAYLRQRLDRRESGIEYRRGLGDVRDDAARIVGPR